MKRLLKKLLPGNTGSPEWTQLEKWTGKSHTTTKSLLHAIAEKAEETENELAKTRLRADLLDKANNQIQEYIEHLKRELEKAHKSIDFLMEATFGKERETEETTCTRQNSESDGKESPPTQKDAPDGLEPTTEVEKPSRKMVRDAILLLISLDDAIDTMRLSSRPSGIVSTRPSTTDNLTQQSPVMSNDGRMDSDAPDKNKSQHLDFIEGKVLAALHALGVTTLMETDSPFDSSLQTAVTVTPTGDPEKDNIVSESLRKGFKTKSRCIRPQEVVVFKLQGQQ